MTHRNFDLMISQADQLVYGVCLFGGGTVDALHPAQTEGEALVITTVHMATRTFSSFCSSGAEVAEAGAERCQGGGVRCEQLVCPFASCLFW